MLQCNRTVILKPSDIYYSQDSISKTFNKTSSHSSYTIRQTLDDLLSGKCDLENIPKISVLHKPGEGGKWFSLDNRRLWIFKQLELVGYCNTTKVKVTNDFEKHRRKFTSVNGGTSIKIRNGGDPGGNSHNLPDNHFQQNKLQTEKALNECEATKCEETATPISSVTKSLLEKDISGDKTETNLSARSMLKQYTALKYRFHEEDINYRKLTDQGQSSDGSFRDEFQAECPVSFYNPTDDVLYYLTKNNLLEESINNSWRKNVTDSAKINKDSDQGIISRSLESEKPRMQNERNTFNFKSVEANVEPIPPDKPANTNYFQLESYKPRRATKTRNADREKENVKECQDFPGPRKTGEGKIAVIDIFSTKTAEHGVFSKESQILREMIDTKKADGEEKTMNVNALDSKAGTEHGVIFKVNHKLYEANETNKTNKEKNKNVKAVASTNKTEKRKEGPNRATESKRTVTPKTTTFDDLMLKRKNVKAVASTNLTEKGKEGPNRATESKRTVTPKTTTFDDLMLKRPAQHDAFIKESNNHPESNCVSNKTDKRNTTNVNVLIATEHCEFSMESHKSHAEKGTEKTDKDRTTNFTSLRSHNLVENGLCSTKCHKSHEATNTRKAEKGIISNINALKLKHAPNNDVSHKHSHKSRKTTNERKGTDINSSVSKHAVKHGVSSLERHTLGETRDRRKTDTEKTKVKGVDSRPRATHHVFSIRRHSPHETSDKRKPEKGKNMNSNNMLSLNATEQGLSTTENQTQSEALDTGKTENEKHRKGNALISKPTTEKILFSLESFIPHKTTFTGETYKEKSTNINDMVSKYAKEHGKFKMKINKPPKAVTENTANEKYLISSNATEQNVCSTENHKQRVTTGTRKTGKGKIINMNALVSKAARKPGVFFVQNKKTHKGTDTKTNEERPTGVNPMIAKTEAKHCIFPKQRHKQPEAATKSTTNEGVTKNVNAMVSKHTVEHGVFSIESKKLRETADIRNMNNVHSSNVEEVVSKMECHKRREAADTQNISNPHEASDAREIEKGINMNVISMASNKAATREVLTFDSHEPREASYRRNPDKNVTTNTCAVASKNEAEQCVFSNEYKKPPEVTETSKTFSTYIQCIQKSKDQRQECHFRHAAKLPSKQDHMYKSRISSLNENVKIAWTEP